MTTYLFTSNLSMCFVLSVLSAPPIIAPEIEERGFMKTHDKLYLGALAALVYVIGVIGGMESSALTLAGGLIRCGLAIAVAAALVSVGLKLERARH